METDQRWTWWTCYFTHFLIPCWLKKWRNLQGFFFFYAVLHLWVLSCWSERLKPLRVDTRRHGDYIRAHCLAEAVSFTVWTSVISRCVNDGRAVLTRMMRCLRVRTPSPTSLSPPPTLHHMMAWVGLPLWVTQLWGAVLARPLSPVSEPRLMTADDDPVVFPPSHTPSLPASLHHPFNIVFFPFICFCYRNHVAENQ